MPVGYASYPESGGPRFNLQFSTTERIKYSNARNGKT